MNYLRMLLKKPETGEQIRKLIPEITGPRGASYLLRKAGKLNKIDARELAGEINRKFDRLLK